MSVYAPRPRPDRPRCPRCGMTEHKPDQFCSGPPSCPYCKQALTRDGERWICSTARYAACEVYSKRA